MALLFNLISDEKRGKFALSLIKHRAMNMHVGSGGTATRSLILCTGLKCGFGFPNMKFTSGEMSK
jgi:hypothetical protein